MAGLLAIGVPWEAAETLTPARARVLAEELAAIRGAGQEDE